MAPTFGYDELNSDQSQVTNDGLRNVGNAAADMVCGLWQNYTEWTSGFADPTGIGRINNALLSRLCKPRGKEPVAPPSLQFTGGQCAKAYSVAVNMNYGSIGNVVNTTIFNVIGPIKGIAPGGSPPDGQIIIGIQAAPTVLRPDGFYPLVQGTKDNLLPYTVNSFVPTPQSGVDDCGNPPVSYPPKTPPASEVNKNQNLNIGVGVVVPVNVVFAPVKVDASVAINPQFQVDVGPFNVTFDAGGVTIAPNFQFGEGGKTLPPPASYPSPNPPVKTPNNTTQACDLTPVTTRLDSITGQLNGIDVQLDDIQDCTCPVGYNVSTIASSTANSGVVSLPTNTIQVRLALVNIPDNPKVIQNGGAGAPLQYFCGYYSFGDGTGLGARTAINTAQSVFEVPLWATSFSWSLYEGYTGAVSFVTLVPDKAGAQLASRQLKLAPS